MWKVTVMRNLTVMIEKWISLIFNNSVIFLVLKSPGIQIRLQLLYKLSEVFDII